jgi:anti-sigma regulatory factor (Ser/Thr protein kinase)
MQGLACDRCGCWELGVDGVTEPDTWMAEGAADVHLCPRCVMDEPGWSGLEVEALRARMTRAVTRSMELHEQFLAVRDEAVQSMRAHEGRPSLEVMLPAAPSSIALARRLVTVFGMGVGEVHRADDLALVTSEVVTHAVIRAGKAARSRLTIHACLDEGAIHVSVRDRSSAVRVPPRRVALDVVDGGDLQIVDTLARGWGSGPGAVWFRL